ncbi:histidine kinase [Paenibacillus lemnae]|uniref:Histidine kinase n=2 Tax=Paenibacillus lemnae TaxID=1330551 RepID=A0A848MAY8_PAELE|nr:histidine kinase [Paenibacillus lemnae]
MILAAVIPTLISMMISYVMTTGSMKERAVTENQNLLYQGSLNLENDLEELDRSSLIVYSDPEFFRSLTYSQEDIRASGRQSATLQTIAQSVNDIMQVYLYIPSRQESSLYAQGVVKKGTGYPLYKDTPDLENQSLQFQTPHPIHTYGFQLSHSYQPEHKVFTLYRSIERVPSTEQLGILAIDVDLTFFSRISSQLYQPDHEQLYIMNEDGMVLYSGNESVIGSRAEQSWAGRVLDSGGGQGHFEMNKHIYLYEPIAAPSGSWTIVKEIPSSYLLQSADKAALINILLLAFSLILIIGASIWVSVYVTKPIRGLVGLMSQVRSGNMTVDVQSDRKDEIGILHRRFSSMMDTINNLILREYKLKLANSNNQLRALQAQVNPHFMNNALQTIGTLALEHNMKRIYSLISALARMMRYSMYNTDKPVTLATELKHVEDYIELQKERFENQFHILYDVKDSTRELLIPKMLIQPLVENFFKHGMDPLSDQNVIGIRSGWHSGSALEITVENNGRSMPEPALMKLQDKLKEIEALDIEQLEVFEEGTSDSEGGIGLLNTLTRLKLFYRGEAGFRVDNVAEGGFRVTMRMYTGGERIESIDRG